MLMVFVLLASVTAAQAAPGDDVKAFPWEGELSGTNVHVRSGPGVNYYPTTKLNVGDRVVVLGEKFGWYQVVPPPKSFSYVDKSMVERQAGSKTGVVSQDRVYIRAGSDLSRRKTSTQLVLTRGAKVEILGEAEGFYRISPPRGAKLYVTKEYVQFVPSRLRTGLVKRYLGKKPGASPKVAPPDSGAADETINAAATANRKRPPLRTHSTSGPKTKGPKATAPRGQDGPSLAVDSTLPSIGEKAADASSERRPRGADATSKVSTAQPTPQLRGGDRAEDRPARSAAETPSTEVIRPSARYQAMLTVLEGELRLMLEKPLNEQDLPAMEGRYAEIAAQAEERLPREIATIRMRQLRGVIDARTACERLASDAEELDAFRSRMGAERMKIMRRRTEAALAKYDLEGELRRSHAFAPEKHRYRLVVPESQKTIAYVDMPMEMASKAEHLVGCVVGIRVARQQYSRSARVPIAVAKSVTDLTPRLTGGADINADGSSNVANKRAVVSKSTEAASGTADAEAAPERPEAVAEHDPEKDK